MPAGPERIKKILDYYSVNGEDKTCKKFNLRPASLERYIRESQIISGEEKPGRIPKEGESIIDRKKTENEEVISIKSYEIRTLEQLLKYTEIDTDVWEVYKSVVNQWGSDSNPCFQVKAWLRLKAPGLDLKKQIEIFKADAISHAPKYKEIKHDIKSDNMLEISCPDLHYGQLSWNKETGRANYDIKTAEQLYINGVSYIILQAKQYTPGRIIFIVGSDFYNVNSLQNTTLAGTKQDEDTRWQRTFTQGRKMVVKAVDMCREIAPVDLIVIPGNHDFERSFYLGESLSCWYSNCNNVRVFNSPRTRKYAAWGRCLIGFTHGDKEKVDRLPLIMATEQKENWARSEYREWHIGHLHHKKSFAWLPVQEENGVRVRIMPSLCARDAWHAESGYDSIREAVGLIWNKERGNIAQFSFTVERGGE